MADLFGDDDPPDRTAGLAAVVSDIGGTAAKVEAARKLSMAAKWYFSQRTAEALDELRAAARRFDEVDRVKEAKA